MALASPMPLDPPVMTAILPSSFPMTSPSASSLWSFGEIAENFEMGPPASGVEGGSAHIAGAKSIQPDDRRQPRRSVSADRNCAVLVGMGYDARPSPTTYERLVDVLDTGFGRPTSRFRIAP